MIEMRVPKTNSHEFWLDSLILVLYMNILTKLSHAFYQSTLVSRRIICPKKAYIVYILVTISLILLKDVINLK